MWNTHPSLVSAVAKQRHRELIRQSDHRRLLRDVRRNDQRQRRT
jgi:hypothetical protein